MFNPTNDYTINKYRRDGIYYVTATGIIRLTREDFDNDDSFQQWKAISDTDYAEIDSGDSQYEDSKVILSDAVCWAKSIEDEMIEAEQEAKNAKARDTLRTEKLKIVKSLLTKKQFSRAWLHYAEGRHNYEIAELEGTTPQAISKSIVAVRKKFQKFSGDRF